MKRPFLFSCLAIVLGCAGFVSSNLAAASTDAHRPKVVMLVAEAEYRTAETLPRFAEKFLAKDFNVVVVTGSLAEGENSFDRIDEVKTADVLLISVRRRTPPAAQLQVIRDYILAGKPVVGIRTASHAFVLREGLPKAGLADWPGWDAQIFGGSYSNHYPDGPAVAITAEKVKHPILEGISLPFKSESKLYKVSPLKPNAQALLLGTLPGEPAQPVAYVFQRADGGHSFYTTLGGPPDFENPSFQHLLLNAITWAAGSAKGASTHASAKAQP